MDDSGYWADLPVEAGLKTRSIHGGIVTAVAQAAKFVLMLASQVLLARLLLPAEFGLVAMVLPVLGFVQIVADLGLTQAIVSRPRLRITELNSFFWANLTLSALMSLVAIALAPALWLAYGEPKVIGVTICSGLLIVVVGAGTLQNALLTRQLRLTQVAIAEVAGLAVSVASSAAAALLGMGYWSLVIGQAALSFTAAGLLWRFSDWRPGKPVLNRESGALLRFGGNVTAFNVASYLNGTVSYLMVGAALGRTALGFYDRAIRLVVQPLSQILAPFNRVAVPALSRLVTNPTKYRTAFVLMTQATMLFLTPTMIFAGLMAKPLIFLALGPGWMKSVPIFAWCCLGAAVTPINSAVYWLLISQDRSREQMVFGSLAAAINIMAYAIGLMLGGVVGVAAVSAISVYLVQSPMLVWVACRRGPLALSDMGKLLVCNAIAGGTAVLVLLYMRHWIERASMPLVLGAAGLITFLVYGLVVACFPAGRDTLKTLLHARTVLRRVKAA